MTFRVIVEPRAEQDLVAAYVRAAEHAPDTAARWFNRFHDALKSLAEHPRRCTIAPESQAVGLEVRQLLFGRKQSSSCWRALFTILGEDVHVLHIRRATMETATSEELFG